MNVLGALIPLTVALFLLAGLLVAEFFLARAESAWPGLVLPAATFFLSLLIPLAAMGAPRAVLALWGVSLIPTLALLVMFFAARASRRSKKQLEKMNIQDLH